MARNSYFSFFDNVVINDIEVKNIFQKYVIKQFYSGNKNIFKQYYIKDFETIEDLAFRWYDDKQLYWIIMLSNNWLDVLYDYPLNTDELKELAQKYYSGGEKTGSLQSIYDSLYQENELKRDIYYLDPELLSDFLYVMRNK